MVEKITREEYTLDCSQSTVFLFSDINRGYRAYRLQILTLILHTATY